LRCTAIRALVFDVVVEHGECFVNFFAQFLVIVDPKSVSLKSDIKGERYLQRQQLFVIHLQQHTSDLASELRLQDLDLGVDGLAE